MDTEQRILRLKPDPRPARGIQPPRRTIATPLFVLVTCALLVLAILFLAAMSVERLVNSAKVARTAPPLPRAGPGQSENPAEWITSDDYPAESIRRREEGTVRIAWYINESGRAFRCATVESSGHPRLDDAACAAILRNAHYAPVAGPTRRFSRRVVWKLPLF